MLKCQKYISYNSYSVKTALMGHKSHFRNILFHSLEKFIFTLESHN